MCQNVLHLSPEKTAVMIFGPTKERRVSTHLNAVSLKTTNKGRNLGEVLDLGLGLLEWPF